MHVYVQQSCGTCNCMYVYLCNKSLMLLCHTMFTIFTDPAVAEDIDQQINEDNTTDVPVAVKEDDSPETERENKLQEIRLKLLEGLVDCLPQLEEVGGLRSIPFLQV